MAENTQLPVKRRNRLLAAQRELARFEQGESEFWKTDRAERAAELRLPLDKTNML